MLLEFSVLNNVGDLPWRWYAAWRIPSCRMAFDWFIGGVFNAVFGLIEFVFVSLGLNIFLGRVG